MHIVKSTNHAIQQTLTSQFTNLKEMGKPEEDTIKQVIMERHSAM